MRRLIDLGYGLLAVAAAPVWLPHWLRTGKHRTDWRGRFGHARPLPSKSARPRVLIHAVSVGEVNAVRLLVQSLMDDADVVLAVTTDTGFARAAALFGGTVPVVRFPFDVSCYVDRFLNAVEPDAVVLIELEVWPNFVATCRRRNVPVCVINGRLSARSHRRYRLIKPVIRRTFQQLAFVAAQSESYAARFRDLGVAPERVVTTGTMKWDTAEIADHVEGTDALAEAMRIDRSRPLIVAGSTAPGEHELLHQAVPDDVQLLCAPRKPEWFDHAETALPGCVRRSRPHSTNSTRHNRFLLDTIGELRMAYALADIVVIGRTFTDLGGSDMIEPVALGKPTVVGPYVSNFEDTVHELLHGGGLIQTTPEHLGGVVLDLLASPHHRRHLAARGREVVRRQQGATARHRDFILNMVSTKFAVPA